MSIEQLDRIDKISKTSEGKIQLTILDDLDWNDEQRHITLLQDKIEIYLEFFATGQLVENYPDALDKEIAIAIDMNFPPTENALRDLEHMAVFFYKKKIDFKWQVLHA